MTYHVSLRVRRRYYNAIVAGFQLVELRRRTPFWEARLEKIRLGKATAIAVFLCGKRTHRRRITEVRVGYAYQFLGREPTEQGRKDIGDGLVYAIFLGEEVDA